MKQRKNNYDDALTRHYYHHNHHHRCCDWETHMFEPPKTIFNPNVELDIRHSLYFVFYFSLKQDIPLHAALLTHLLIAWDRMRWLADPMNARFPAFVCSCATWLTGMVIALPYPIYTTYLDLGVSTIFYYCFFFISSHFISFVHEYCIKKCHSQRSCLRLFNM